MHGSAVVDGDVPADWNVMKRTMQLVRIKASRPPTSNACTLALTRSRFVSQPVAWAWNNTSSRQVVTSIAGQVTNIPLFGQPCSQHVPLTQL